MLLVCQSGGAGELDGPGHHEPGMLTDVTEEGDDVGIAGVPAKAEPGQVAALGNGVDGQHSVGAVRSPAAPNDRGRLALPRQLGVALVTGHEHAPFAAPCRRRGQVVELASGVAGAIDPQDQRPGGVRLADRTAGKAYPELFVDRHGDGP